MVRNQAIRDELKNQTVRTWELAEHLGVHETTLYRYLRKNLSREQKQRYLQAINEIAKSKAR
ncbi:hypothetical protein [Lentibacillus cibarius]|uniref:Uncharacterized protein n=1 Tax=Lentibacillus cibarius TaxID=2583219 RepID=A0A5S3R7H8_9BACI|nr:hypothetical protein [Lentibacillus cibarius]TMN21833.1 hypothetical protein FFL34_06685 [Lentibacillus cibarius]